MSGAPKLAPRIILTVVAIATGFGCYIADFNETHVHNPLWPGHARFHNGQTMSMGVFFMLTTLWKTWFDDRDGLFTASVLASGYYVTMFSAMFYPGSTGWDPPEQYSVEFPQLFVLGPLVALVALAFGLERMGSGARRTEKKVN